MPLRVVFMGTPDFAVPTLLEIVNRNHEVVAVYTGAPKPAGRRGMEVIGAHGSRRRCVVARRRAREERRGAGRSVNDKKTLVVCVGPPLDVQDYALRVPIVRCLGVGVGVGGIATVVELLG